MTENDIDTQTRLKVVMQATDISKQYDNSGSVTEILRGLNLTVYDGDFVCILGPSGCGKTTLLRCIAGFETYTGTIKVSGETVNSPGPDRIMVFQDFDQLYPWKTIIQNIQYPLQVKGEKDKGKTRACALEYLKKVGLSDYADYYPHQLSGGMKQRAAIAKALALKPRLILMDEPFASLDAITRKALQKELLHIKEQESMTVIFITHNIQEAIMLGTRVVTMGKEGAIKEDHPILLPKPTTPANDGFRELWEHFSDLLETEASII